MLTKLIIMTVTFGVDKRGPAEAQGQGVAESSSAIIPTLLIKYNLDHGLVC
jgi:hypothetical protein